MSTRYQKKALVVNGVACYGFSLALTVGLCNAPFCHADEKKSDWPLYSRDFSNTNNNPKEKSISAATVPHLVKAWETFNDDSVFPVPAPSGFILEGALGLVYPSSVVGIVSPPLIQDGTIYYVDQLGTVFARDAKTGTILDPERHWTVHLVDPDYELNQPAPMLLPELYYTAPALTDDYLWLVSSVHGRLHAVSRSWGAELDFDPSTPEIEPYKLANAPLLASSLGESVIIKQEGRDAKTDDGRGAEHERALLIRGMDVILNDAIVQGGEVGLVVMLDITDPARPKEVWRTSTVELDPATGKRFGSGVSAGSGLAVDMQRHWVFGGTGQWTSLPYEGYPDAPAPAGFVDRSDSVWAIDYRTGRFVWVNQFHEGDVFNLNTPESSGPNNPNFRDADVLSPPVLFTARTADGKKRDLVAVGSKGGLFRAVDRDTGATVWERQISKRTGLGGIQAGAAVADGAVYVAGFEGLDDGYSDATFNTPGSRWANAFFATFSPLFWAEMEDVSDDGDPSTGVRTKVYSLDAATGASHWHFDDGKDYVELLGGAAMRHVSTANGLVYVTTSDGKLVVLNAENGSVLFSDQTRDLNDWFGLGLGKPHHAAMNAGTVISDGMVYVPSGGQNDPSGGMTAYTLEEE